LGQPTHLLLRNMDSDLAQAFHKEVTCLFCLHYLTDPVTLGCGHSFCRPCVCLFWEAAEVPATCPVCGQPSQLTHYNTNFLLKNLVSTARKASVRRFLSSEAQRCGPHKEAKQIFCEEDRSLLCRHCSQSPEHETHRHCSTEGAAEEYREKLSKQMRSVWQKIQDIERNLAKDGRISIYWMMYVTHHKDMTRAVYRPLHPILLEEEHQHLELLKEEGQKGVAQLEKIRCQILDRKRHLRMVYRELRKMCQKPDVELLLELGDMLKWSEQAIQGHIPQRLRPELRARPITGLMDRLNHFRVEISFDNAITNHHIRLLEEVRSVKFLRDSVSVCLAPATSNYIARWGTQCLASGKHYWEVEVDDSGDWAVGVCGETQARAAGPLTDAKDTFLLLCVREGDGPRLWTTGPMRPQYTEIPLGSVGVFLDFDSGSLSFVDVGKRSFIWKYPGDFFHFLVRPFFCTGRPR
ncbi:Tripartite Motif-Containing Protein 43, partial [Manis pentadactyla]